MSQHLAKQTDDLTRFKYRVLDQLHKTGLDYVCVNQVLSLAVEEGLHKELDPVQYLAVGKEAWFTERAALCGNLQLYYLDEEESNAIVDSYKNGAEHFWNPHSGRLCYDWSEVWFYLKATELFKTLYKEHHLKKELL